MTYTHKVTDNKETQIFLNNELVDTVGPWDSTEGADQWGAAICEKYNAPEYVNTPYPQQLEAE